MHDFLNITYNLLKLWSEKRGSSSVLRRKGTFKGKTGEIEEMPVNNAPVIPDWMPQEMKAKINRNYEQYGHNDIPEWLPENYDSSHKTK